MKLSIRAKNGLLITGTALVCVGAIIAVLNMSSSAAATEPVSAASSSPSTSAEISVPPIEIQTVVVESGTSSVFVPESGASQTTELTEIQKPTSAPPAPSVPSGTDLTDKSKKPSYTSSASSSAPANSTKQKTSSSTKSSGTPKMGDKRTSNGQKQVYIDGFGWVEDGGGGGKGTTVGNPGDELTGNKVGIMD